MTGRRTRSLILASWAVLASSGLAYSQGGAAGSLGGVVRDAKGLLLPGVTVRVSGPEVAGYRAATTDTNGRYDFPTLPPGPYTVTYELLGHASVSREEVVVTAGEISELEVDLVAEIAPALPTAEPVGPPVVDVETTAAPSVLPNKEQELDGVPNAATMWAILAHSPAVQMRGHDVGGSQKAQQTEYDTFGVRSQNQIVHDGVDTTEGTGRAGGQYDFHAIDEIRVRAQGLDVEMTTPGAQIVATWKTGGDRFSGAVQGDYVHADLISDNFGPELAERGATPAKIRESYDYHVELRGPVVKNRAWFYLAHSRSFIDRAVSGQDPAVATDIADVDTFTGKLNLRLTDRDELTAFGHWSFKQRPNGGLSLTVPPESVLAQESRTGVFKLDWRRSWSDRLSSSLLVGHFEREWDAVPVVDPSSMPARFDTATGMRSGAAWAPFNSRRWKPQGAGRIEFRAGGHHLKLGVDFQLDRNGFAWSAASGAILYLDNSEFGQPAFFPEEETPEDPDAPEGEAGDEAGAPDDEPVAPDDELEDEPDAFVDRILFANVPNQGERDHNRRTDFFIQDVWRMADRFTLTLGLRVGQQHVYYDATENDPLQTDIFASTSARGRDVIKRRNYAPRLGMAFDLTGRGKSVLKAYFGRFYANVGSGLPEANPAGRGTRTYEFRDLNQDGTYSGPQELGDVLDASGGGATQLDPEFELAFSDEYSVSLEHELATDLGVRFSFVHKRYRNWWDASINLAQALNLTEPFTATCTGCPFELEDSELNLLTIPDDQETVVDSRIANVPLLPTTGGANTDMSFTTWQLAFTRRFRDGWFLSASFDRHDRDELRTPEASTSPYVTDPLGQGWFQNHSADVANRQETTYWTGKLLTRYQAPFGLGMALSFRYQSGFPWAPVHHLVVPNVGTRAILLGDLSENRSPDIALFDVRLDQSFRFGDHYRLTAVADLYNVFNDDAVTNFILNTGSRFEDVIDRLPGRTLKLGLRFEF